MAPNGLPREGHVCVGAARYLCLADGTADEAPCPSGGACNACGGCGAVPVEVCNFADDDCDGAVDEGVRNACGGCGAVPIEVCNFVDDDCDGAVDEGVRNACGGCGAVPIEVCNFVDDDCDGAVDEGVRNACNLCGPVAGETCNYLDDDCDGETDEGVRNGCDRCGEGGVEVCNDIDDDCDGETDEGFAGRGEVCSAGVGACTRSGLMRCAGSGDTVACAAIAGEPSEETCNGQDDDCDGETDEGYGVGVACSAGQGRCAVAGEMACDASEDLVCVAGAKACDDGDPCTTDTCDEVAGCGHEAIADCCARPGSSCRSGEACFSGRCEAVLCHACEPASGCPDGAECVAYPGGSACATRCEDLGCPAGFTCTAFTSDGRLAPRSICLADSETCACEAPPGPVCDGARWVSMRNCDVLGEVLAVCERGCAEGVGCCPEGTRLVDGACVEANEAAPSPRAKDDGCGQGGAGWLAWMAFGGLVGLRRRRRQGV
jgi:hypothetical protein